MTSLIVYYSRAGENYFSEGLRYIDKGNTETAAEILQKLTGADMFKLEQAEPYSDDYKTCVEQARKDLKNSARPELKSMPENTDKYDRVYLGFPSYCGTVPMAVLTFLENICSEGKTIMPFCTNEGSGMGSSERDIRKACPGAEVKKGLSIRGADAADSESLFAEWIE